MSPKLLRHPSQDRELFSPPEPATMLSERSVCFNTHPIVALHRYLIWAAQMDTNFKHLLPQGAKATSWWDTDFIASVMYMSYSYATLYVVIEGWRQLKLTDPTIDDLLRSPNVNLLRRFRNGAYHFQPEYFDGRLTDFTAAACNHLHGSHRFRSLSRRTLTTGSPLTTSRENP
jgi:hypothetical protein